MGEALHFMLMGFLGAFLYVLMWAKKPENLYSFEAVRHLVVGVIVGYIYSILYSEYNFPKRHHVAGSWLDGGGLHREPCREV
jgi:hypothetical protein